MREFEAGKPLGKPANGEAPGTTSHEWELAIAEEKEAREAYEEIRRRGHTTKAALRDAAQHWHSHLAQILTLQAEHGGALPPLPSDVCQVLAELMRDLAYGVLPASVSDIGKKPGAKPADYKKRKRKAAAAAYLERAESGEFPDPRANQTVGECYGYGDNSGGNHRTGTTSEEAAASAREKAAASIRRRAPEYRKEFPEYWRMAPEDLSAKMEEAGRMHKEDRTTKEERRPKKFSSDGEY